jgi:hypothetical protein
MLQDGSVDDLEKSKAEGKRTNQESIIGAAKMAARGRKQKASLL